MHWGSLSRAARATYPRGTAWKIQEPGQPSPTLTGPCDAQAATARRPGGEKRGAGGGEQPVALGVCGRASCLGVCLLPSPGAARGPAVLRPLKPLVLSPRRPGSVCVSGAPSSAPPTLPRHRETGQGPRARHGGREKRKCFIYGTYLISLFN